MNPRVAALARRMPVPHQLARWWVAVSAADVLLSAGSPAFTYDPDWDEAEHCAQFSIGSGDEASVTFTEHGAFLRGFDHESPLSPWARPDGQVDPRLLAGLPDDLRPCADEPAFTVDGVSDLTLALWSTGEEHGWSCGPELDPEQDGGVWLFDVMDGNPDTYIAWAQDYYGTDVDRDIVAAIFRNEDLSDDDILTLCPDCDVDEMREHLDAVNFPIPEA